MLKKTITVIGGSVQDIMFYTDQAVLVNNKKDLLRQKLIGFEYGAKVHSDRVYFSHGGGGANTAVTLASLGLKTKIITAVGDDALGRDVLANLRRQGIDLKAVQVFPGQRTALSMVVNIEHDKEHVLFSYRGASSRLVLSSQVIRKINTPWVYLNSLAKISPAQLGHFFQHCAKQKINIAWNPDARQIGWGFAKIKRFLNKRVVLIVNRDEALELVAGLLGTKKVQNNIAFLFKKLQREQRITVITDGPRGAYVYDGSKIYFRPATNHRPVSTLGAGDAFGSGFVAGLIKYRGDIVRALHLGILNSGAVVAQIGAQAGILRAVQLKRFGL